MLSFEVIICLNNYITSFFTLSTFFLEGLLTYHIILEVTHNF